MIKYVLDQGFVRLEDFMGGDAAVVRSARVSYNKSGTVDVAKDEKLVRYMISNEHGTPFESTVFTFHVQLPIFVVRQWHRHRIGWSYNEMSARYTEMPDKFYIPTAWRAQSKENKQGSAPYEVTASMAPLEYHCNEAMRIYRGLIENNVAREMARMVLPVNLYTQMYATVNARALMHFIELRSHDHAQAEMQDYSRAMFEVLAEKMPWTAKAFAEQLMNSAKRFPLIESLMEGLVGMPREALTGVKAG